MQETRNGFPTIHLIEAVARKFHSLFWPIARRSIRPEHLADMAIRKVSVAGCHVEGIPRGVLAIPDGDQVSGE